MSQEWFDTAEESAAARSNQEWFDEDPTQASGEQQWFDTDPTLGDEAPEQEWFDEAKPEHVVELTRLEQAEKLDQSAVTPAPQAPELVQSGPEPEELPNFFSRVIDKTMHSGPVKSTTTSSELLNEVGQGLKKGTLNVIGGVEGLASVATGLMAFTGGMGVSLLSVAPKLVLDSLVAGAGSSNEQKLYKLERAARGIDSDDLTLPVSEYGVTADDAFAIGAALEHSLNSIMEGFTYNARSKMGQTVAEYVAMPFSEAHKGIDILLKDHSQDARDTASFLFDFALIAGPKVGKAGIEAAFTAMEKRSKGVELTTPEIEALDTIGQEWRNVEVIEQARKLEEEQKAAIKIQEETDVKAEQTKLRELEKELKKEEKADEMYDEPTMDEIAREEKIIQNREIADADSMDRVEMLKEQYRQWEKEKLEAKQDLEFELGFEETIRRDLERKQEGEAIDGAEPSNKKSRKSVDLEDKVTEHILFADEEVTAGRAKLYEEDVMKRRVSDEPETAMNKLINDVNRSVHGDETVDLPGTRLMLQTLVDSADFLGLDEYAVKQAEAGLEYSRIVSGKEVKDNSIQLNMAVDPKQFYAIARDSIKGLKKLTGAMKAKSAKQAVAGAIGQPEMINTGLMEWFDTAIKEGRKVTKEEIEAAIRPLMVKVKETNEYDSMNRPFVEGKNYHEKLYMWDDGKFYYEDPHFSMTAENVVMNSRVSDVGKTRMIEEMQSKYWAEESTGKQHTIFESNIADTHMNIAQHLRDAEFHTAYTDVRVKEKSQLFIDKLDAQLAGDGISAVEYKVFKEHADIYGGLEALKENGRFSYDVWMKWKNDLSENILAVAKQGSSNRPPFQKSWQHQVMLSELVEAAKKSDSEYFGWSTAETVSKAELGVEIPNNWVNPDIVTIKDWLKTTHQSADPSTVGRVQNFINVYDNRGQKVMKQILRELGIKAEVERVEGKKVITEAELNHLTAYRDSSHNFANQPYNYSKTVWSNGKIALKALDRMRSEIRDQDILSSIDQLTLNINDMIAESRKSEPDMQWVTDAVTGHSMKLNGLIRDIDSIYASDSHYRVKLTPEMKEKLVGEPDKVDMNPFARIEYAYAQYKSGLLTSAETVSKMKSNLAEVKLTEHRDKAFFAERGIREYLEAAEGETDISILGGYLKSIRPIAKYAAERIVTESPTPSHGIYLRSGLGKEEFKMLSDIGKQALAAAGDLSRWTVAKSKLGDKLSKKGLDKDFVETAERWWDVSAASKKLLDELGTQTADRAYRLLSLRQGASTAADIHVKRMRNAVYSGLSRQQRGLMDQIMYLKRVVAIDKVRAKEAIETGKHRKVRHEKLSNEEMKKYGIEGEAVEVDGLVANQALRELEQAIGAKRFSELNARTEIGFQIMHDMLKTLHDQDIISAQLYNKLKDVRYIPRKNLLDAIDPISTHSIGKTPITLRESGVRAIRKGDMAERFEKDSELLMADVIHSVYGRIARNNANRALVEMAKESPDNGFVMIPKVKSKEGKVDKLPTPPSGWSKVDLFTDGKKQRMFLRNDFARGWVSGNRDISYNIARQLQLWSGSVPLKVTAVAWNQGFGAVNLIRDGFHVWMATQRKVDGKWTSAFSPHLPVYVAQYTKAMGSVAVDSIMRRGRWNDAVHDGMGMKFMAQEGRVFRKHAVIQTPVDYAMEMLGYIGETTEILSRLAIREHVMQAEAKRLGIPWEEFQAANKKLRPTFTRTGKLKTNPEAASVDPKLAAEIGLAREKGSFSARDFMDFSNRGSYGEAVDTVTPFFNAGVQGTRGLWRAAKRDKKGFYTKLAYLGGTASMFYAWNNISQDRKEAYDKIPQYAKDKNFIITTDVKIFDEFGEERRMYIKIPKDPSQQYFASAFEAATGLMMGHEVDVPKVKEFAGSLTPLEGPIPSIPTVDMILGSVYNFDLQRSMWDGKNAKVWNGPEFGKDNRKEEFVEGRGDRDTPAWAVAIGELTGISPVKAEHGINSYFAKGPMTMFAGSMASKAAGEGQERDMMWAEALSKYAVARRFFGLTGSEDVKMREGDYEIKNKERLKDFIVDREMDKLLYQYLVNEDVGIRELYGLKKKYPKYQKKINDDISFALKLKDYGQDYRSFWMRMRGENDPVAQAAMYHVRYEKVEGEDKLELELARRQLGFDSDNFIRELTKLKIETSKEEKVEKKDVTSTSEYKSQLASQENRKLTLMPESMTVKAKKAPESGGGLDIGFGHKLTSEEKESGKVYGIDWNEGISVKQAYEILDKDIVKKTDQARRIIGSKFDQLPVEAKELLTDYAFTGTLKSFPKFSKAIVDGDYATAKKEYVRHMRKGGKMVKLRRRNKYALKAIEDLKAQGWLS